MSRLCRPCHHAHNADAYGDESSEAPESYGDQWQRVCPFLDNHHKGMRGRVDELQLTPAFINEICLTTNGTYQLREQKNERTKEAEGTHGTYKDQQDYNHNLSDLKIILVELFGVLVDYNDELQGIGTRKKYL